MLKYITIYNSAETICFITALLCLFNARQLHWRLLIPLMLVTCLVEISSVPLKALYRANPIPMNSSAWLYNILLLCQICILVLVFHNLIGKYVRSKAPMFIAVVLLLSLYCYELFTNEAGIFNYNAITYSAMSVLFVLYSLYYFYLLLNSEEYADLKYMPEFWWVTGTLFFFFGTTACNLFYVKLLAVSDANKVYLSYISDILIIILYGCWTYAFICKRWLTSNK